MKLGILVNTNRHLEHARGITRAAIAKDHEVIIFIMDEGTRLLGEKSFVELAELPGVSMSLCEHSAKGCGVNTTNFSEDVDCASQLNNAMMNQSADKVIVL